MRLAYNCQVCPCYYSLTQTLFELGLPSFHTTMSNSKFRFSCHLHSCSNMLVEHVTKISS